MPTLTGVVVLPVPTSVVAAVVLDWTQDPRWRPGVVRFEATPAGAAVAGQRLVEHLRTGGRVVRTPTTVTESVPGHTAAYVGGGRALRVAGRRTVEPAREGGASVRLELTLALRGPAAPLSPLLARVYRRRFRAELRHLAGLPDFAPA